MPRPDISVVVPSRNRAAIARDALAHLRRLDPPPGGFEILLIDDGSDPPVDATDLEGPVLVRVLRQPHAGPGAARNLGAAYALAPLLAFTDDDCRPAKNWLVQLHAAHRAAPKALLGGRTRNALRENRWSEASELIVRMARRHYNRDLPRFFPSNNLAAPTELFRSLGGFDPRFVFASEDRDLCDRWHQEGLPLREVPEAKVDHHHPLTAAQFVEKHRRYGRGARQFHRRRAQRGSKSVGATASFHLALPALLRREWPELENRRVLWPLGLWQLANLVGFLSAGPSREANEAADHLPLEPITGPGDPV